MKAGAFARWFVAQHGPRERTTDSDQELIDRMAVGRRAEQEAQRRFLWDERRISALYAWQISDAQKRTAAKN